MHCHERLAIESEAVARSRRRERYTCALEIERARDQPPALYLLEQLRETAVTRERLEHELDRAAARQAEFACVIGADAVGHRLRTLHVRAFATRTLDDVVLDAATGNRA